MAAYQEKLQENLSCPICYQTFNYEERLPKGLPCLHTLCLSCLYKIVKKNLEEKYLCPICQAKFSVPNGGVEDIPNNTSLVGMLELLETKDTATIENEHEEDRASTHEKLEIPKCPDHRNATCILFCKECHMPLCTKCMTINKTHNNHKLEDIVLMTEMMNSDVDKNVKLFNKIVNEFDQFTDETLSIIFNQKSYITARIKEDINREADRLYAKRKGQVESHFRHLLQEFHNFTSQFYQMKRDFEDSLKKYTANKSYNADPSERVAEMKEKMKCLQMLKFKSPQRKTSLPTFVNSFNVGEWFEQKHDVSMYAVETQTDSNECCSMVKNGCGTGGSGCEAILPIENDMAVAELRSAYKGSSCEANLDTENDMTETELKSASKGSNTDELTLTSIPIMIPSDTVDLHLHITNWIGFMKKNLNEELSGDAWFAKEALWRVVTYFNKPEAHDNRFPSKDMPVMYVGVRCEKRSKRSNYSVTRNVLFKNYRSGFWESHNHRHRNYGPHSYTWGKDMFSKEWLLSEENPFVRNNAMHICVLLEIE